MPSPRPGSVALLRRLPGYLRCAFSLAVSPPVVEPEGGAAGESGGPRLVVRLASLQCLPSLCRRRFRCPVVLCADHRGYVRGLVVVWGFRGEAREGLGDARMLFDVISVSSRSSFFVHTYLDHKPQGVTVHAS